jgi:hypothetical protein
LRSESLYQELQQRVVDQGTAAAGWFILAVATGFGTVGLSALVDTLTHRSPPVAMIAIGFALISASWVGFFLHVFKVMAVQRRIRGTSPDRRGYDATAKDLQGFWVTMTNRDVLLQSIVGLAVAAKILTG